MKKTLSLILALLMSASCASYILADEADVETTAVIEEDAVVEEVAEEAEEVTEYDDALKFLTLKNIMHGMEDGRLHAELGVERYQMALFVGRVSTGWVVDSQWEDGIANDSQFKDLAGTAAENVYGAISYVNQKGIIEGYEDGSFKPEKGVTYREALTMAVRTLEYQGLDYPWGYIEKAIGLGLTDGISGVAYTDEIDRGVAAQIVYNMLFADTKSGDTLAMRSFGVDFGWRNIIVTANNKNTYEAGAKTTTNAGVSAFKLINEDGTLGDETYYLNEDLAVGSMYNALFEINGNDDYVDVVGAHEYVATVIENKGLTDDEGVAYDDADAIGTFLKDYTLVDKYGSSILANSNLYRNELIVASANETVRAFTGKVDASLTKYAFNWATGDILVKVDDGDNKFHYEVEWYYNAEYDYYFNIATDKADKKDIVDENGNKLFVGINIMDAKDVADLKDAMNESIKIYDNFAAYNKMTSVATTAYAALATYDLNGDDAADYATYEAYSLAKFETTKDKCDKCNSDKDAYQFVAYNLGSSKNESKGKYIAEGVCDHYSVKDGKIGANYTKAWTFAADSIVPENGDVVIYGANYATNELKVVKVIGKLGENTDADSYIARGVVRGYSYKNNEVTIGDDNYKYDYATLAGNAFVKVGDNKAAYSNALSALLNQYVEYIVVDGKLVYVKTVGNTDSNYIVVESFAGIDSDGYIVVNGYSTDDLAYDQFRIGSYDNWVRGDFFSNPNQVKKQFVKGTVYKITSADVDAENGTIYYVETLTKVVKVNGDATGYAVKADTKNVEITFENGYRVIGDNAKKVSGDDKYIIIGDAGKYMPIYVFEGKVTNMDWTVTGDLLVGGADKSTFIIVNADVDTLEGFNADTTKTGFVAVLKKTITEVNYNGYSKDYYIYGQTNYTVEVFNLLTGKKDESRVGANIDLEAGRIYYTIDDTIIDIDGNQDMKWSEFVTDAKLAYKDLDLDTADYRFFTIKKFNTIEKVDCFTKENFSKEYVTNELFAEYDSEGKFVSKPSKKYKDLVSGLDVFEVTVDGDKVTAIDSINADGFAKNYTAKNITVDAFVVYNMKTQKAVVYLTNDTKVTTTVKTDDVKASNKLEVVGTLTEDRAPDVANIEATANVETTKVGSKLTSAKINGLTFTFAGAATNDTHYAVDFDNFHFGEADACKLENWNAVVSCERRPYEDFVLGERVYGTLKADVYDNHEDVEDCNLIKAINVTFDKALAITNDGFYVFNVDFTANERIEDGAEIVPTNYVFVVTAWIDGNDVNFKFEQKDGDADSTRSESTINGEVLDIVK